MWLAILKNDMYTQYSLLVTVKIARRVRLTQFGLPQLHQKVVLHHGTVVESLHVTGFT